MAQEDSEFVTAPSSFNLFHNNIKMTPDSSCAGFELYDSIAEAGGAPSAKVKISNNTIESSHAAEPYGPIFSYFIDSAEISNNTVSGTGAAAINAEPFSTTGKNWKITGNNLSGFIPKSSPTWKNEPAHIMLGPGTSGFTVIGTSDNERVLDFGTDNTVTNAMHLQRSKPDYAPGRELLNKKLEMLKKLKVGRIK